MAEQKILYGGQAVVEGVMVRGRNFVSCAVRRLNGEIAIKNQPIPHNIYAGVWSKTPFLRALPLLWDTLVLGTSMLMWAGNIQAADVMAADKAAEPAPRQESLSPDERRELVNALEAQAGEAMVAGAPGMAEAAAMMAIHEQENDSAASIKTPTPEKNAEPEGLPPAAIYTTLAVSLGLGIVIFFLLPVFVASFLGSLGMPPFWNNIVEGLIRLALFLAYLIGIGRIPEIQRVFMYHGAEHKTIAAYEGGVLLIPPEIQKFSKEHPRCGTGFLLTVVVISILFFVLLGDLPLPIRLASRIILIPIVAAVSYELIRFSSQHRNIFLFDWLIVRPSLALQSLTTREPNDDMIQVAVAAFQDVKKKEESLAVA